MVGEEAMLDFKAIVRTSAMTLSGMVAIPGFEAEERHDPINV